MTIYFAGTERDAVEGGTGVTTTNTYYDPNYSNLAVVVSGTVTGGYTLPTEIGSNGGFWVAFTHYSYATGTTWGDHLLTLLDQSNNICAQIYRSNDDYMLRVYNSSNSYANSLLFEWAPNQLVRYDINVYTENNVCYAKCYRNNLLMAGAQLAGVNRGLKAFQVFKGAGNGSFGTTAGYVSEIIIADEPTLGMRVKTYRPTADGTHTTWEGTFDNVNNDDTSIDAISTQLPNAAETFLHGQTLNEGTAIRAIAIGAAIASNNPADASAVLNIGGTLYQKTFEKPLTQGAAPNIAIYETNPATGVSFTAADFNSLEFGVQHS